MAQVYAVALSPTQRFMLFQFSRDEAAKIKDREEGKRYRRWTAAFGIDVIIKAGRVEGRVNAQTVLDETPQLFQVTTENAEFCIKFFNRELPAAFEDVCGELMDTLDDIVRGRTPDVVECADYDPATEYLRWAPPKA